MHGLIMTSFTFVKWVNAKIKQAQKNLCRLLCDNFMVEISFTCSWNVFDFSSWVYIINEKNAHQIYDTNGMFAFLELFLFEKQEKNKKQFVDNFMHTTEAYMPIELSLFSNRLNENEIIISFEAEHCPNAKMVNG